MKFVLIFGFAALMTGCSIDAPEVPEKSSAPAPSPAPEAPLAPAPPAENPVFVPQEIPQVKIIEMPVGDDHAVAEPLKIPDPIAPPPPPLKLFHQFAADDNLAAFEAHLSSGKTSGMDEQDAEGRVPLHLARSAKIAEFLWDRPVRTGTEKNGRRYVPVFTPAALVADREGLLPFHRIVLNGEKDALKTALNRWCSWYRADLLNAKDGRGRSILHLAAVNGDPALTKMILGCRWIDLSAKDADGRTALHHAAEHRDFAAGFLIVKTKAFNSVEPDKFGETALSLAKRAGNSDSGLLGQ